MPKPKNNQDEKDLEKLAKTLLSTPPKPRDQAKTRKERADEKPSPGKSKRD